MKLSWAPDYIITGRIMSEKYILKNFIMNNEGTHLLINLVKALKTTDYRRITFGKIALRFMV